MNPSLAVLGLSGGELIIVLVAILVLFGAKRIPEFAKGLGQGIKEFKKASNEVTQEFQNAMDDSNYSKPAPPAAPQIEHQTPSPNVAPQETAQNTPPSTVPKT
ncbi:MAG: Sec-independent protein translocase subunit TatA/TatB [Limisphaerales bacterium]